MLLSDFGTCSAGHVQTSVVASQNAKLKAFVHSSSSEQVSPIFLSSKNDGMAIDTSLTTIENTKELYLTHVVLLLLANRENSIRNSVLHNIQ